MKKIVSLAMIIIALIALCGCDSESEDLPEQDIQIEDEIVLGVKGGSPNGYPDATYGEAFEYFFGDPTWTYFEGKRENDDSTYDIVEFTGNCMYQDTEVKALIQFTISEDGETFEPTYLSLNDIPQNEMELGAIIDKAFEDYLDAKEMESKKATPTEE